MGPSEEIQFNLIGKGAPETLADLTSRIERGEVVSVPTLMNDKVQVRDAMVDMAGREITRLLTAQGQAGRATTLFNRIKYAIYQMIRTDDPDFENALTDIRVGVIPLLINRLVRFVENHPRMTVDEIVRAFAEIARNIMTGKEESVYRITRLSSIPWNGYSGTGKGGRKQILQERITETGNRAFKILNAVVQDEIVAAHPSLRSAILQLRLAFNLICQQYHAPDGVRETLYHVLLLALEKFVNSEEAEPVASLQITLMCGKITAVRSMKDLEEATLKIEQELDIDTEEATPTMRLN